jgi:hypothetical protein
MDKRTVLMAVAMVALLAFDQAQAGVVEDYNAKPLASGRDSHDSRFQDRTRHPGDPEVVLGRDWRRSFWAFSPSFAEKLVAPLEVRPPQPPNISVENLSPGLEAIELRVTWDAKENLYRCSYHLFVSRSVPIAPEADRVHGVGSGPDLPPGIGLRHPDQDTKGLGFTDVAIVSSPVQMLNLSPMLDSLRRDSFGGTTYVSFHQGICSALGSSAIEKGLNVGLLIDPRQPWSGPTKKVMGRTYAAFTVPPSLIKSGAPFFRRAEKINFCYLGERRVQAAIDAQPPAFTAQRERECQQLRTLPIVSTEKAFDAK